MLRLAFFLLLLFSLFSCIRRKDIGPAPEIEFLEFKYIGPEGHDTAEFQLGYIDTDGDLFWDQTNLIVNTYVWSVDSGKFVFDLSWQRIIRPPGNGIYDGKSIEGYIYLNEKEWRSSLNNVVRFDIVMVDKKGNASNVVSTPSFTINEAPASSPSGGPSSAG